MSANPDLLRGLFPPLPTPFAEDGSLDLDGLGALLERVLAAGLRGVTLLGSSGEVAYLTDAERERVLVHALGVLRGRAAALVGIARYGTRAAVEDARRARELGAAGLLVALPQYYRTPLAAVVAHYAAVVREGALPTLYYHYPEPTHLHLAPAQLATLFDAVPLAGIKESGFSTPELRAHLGRVRRPVRVFTGQSFDLLPALDAGAVGAICPLGVLMPRTSLGLLEAHAAGDRARAAALQDRLYDALPILSPGELPEGLVRRALRWSLARGVALPKPPGVPHAGLKEALVAVGVLRSAAVRAPQPLPGAWKRARIRELAPALAEL